MRLDKIPEFTDYLDGLETDYELPKGLLGGVMHTESRGQNDARSPKGARGAFQFMPATAKEYGIDPLDPIQAADGAARYLRKSLDRFGNIEEAVASYNAGSGRIAKTGVKGAPRETRDYVGKVLNFLIPAAEASESEMPPAAEADFDSMSTEDLEAMAGIGAPPSATHEPPAPPAAEDEDAQFASMSVEELEAMALASMSPEQRSAFMAEKLGPPEPASALETAGNALSGAGYALGDIPAGIEQLASRYLPLPDSYEQGVSARVAEYEAEKKRALDKPGGTAGYVGGQIGTAFVPGTGAVKVLSTAGKAAKVAAAARPVAAGTALTAVKPYETEADRGQAVAISAGLGATIPAVAGVARGIGGVIRPRVPVPPTGKPPAPPGAIPGAADDVPLGAAPAGVPPGSGPPGGVPPVPPVPPDGGFGDAFIRKLKAAPESRKKGELLESAARLGVTPTPGQVAAGLPKFLEEQMMKLPGSRGVADKAGRASHESYHRALGRQMGLEDMEIPYLTMDVIEAGKKKLSDVYDEILPQAQVTKGTAVAGKLEFDAAKLTAPFSEVVGATVKKGAMKELQRIQDGITAGLKTGHISGEDLKVLQTRVRKLGEDPKLHNAVQDRFENFRTALGDTLATSLDETSPELAARLRLTDKQWANASILHKVQSSAGANVEGFISGPTLHNTILARYKNPSKAGDFGKLAEMGRMFYQKAPDSGTADRILSNTILTGTGVGAFIDPTTAASVYLAPKLAAHAYYQTPAYLRTVRAGRAVGSAGTRGGASGAGRTGRSEDKPSMPGNSTKH